MELTIYTMGQAYEDFAGAFMHGIIIVDVLNKWPEVILITVTSVEKTVMEMRKLFATHEYPCQIVSDSEAQ